MKKSNLKPFTMKWIALFTFIITLNCYSQDVDNCNIKKSDFINILKVDKDELICIAKNSDKPYTVFYTLASWCSPCRMHFPDAVELEKSGKVNLFVVLVQSEQDRQIGNAINFIQSVSPEVKFGVLNDDIYGQKTGKRNKKFAIEITPENNEMIDDYGKFILVDNTGQVLYVTNWKDYNKEWKDAKKMLQHTILPLIE